MKTFVRPAVVTIEYPLLMECDGIVVLFSHRDSGMVLLNSSNTNEPHERVGVYSTTWNEALFTMYENSILVQN